MFLLIFPACVEAFFPTVDKPTVIVTDQASIHTSDAILDKLEEWQERNLTIFTLPTYSPQLNLIQSNREQATGNSGGVWRGFSLV